MVSVLKLMEQGKYDLAIPLLERKCEQGGGRQDLARLGWAYFLVGKVAKATKEFDKAIDAEIRVRQRCDSTYAIAGICRWIRRMQEEAVATWMQGLRCDYSGHNSFLIPSLLWYVSRVAPSLYRSRDAIKIFRELVTKEKNKLQRFASMREQYAELSGIIPLESECWSLPIGKYILGEICGAELKKIAQDPKRHELTRRRQLGESCFYIAINELSRRDGEHCANELNNCLALLADWHCPEYFLARHELKQLRKQAKNSAQRKPTKGPGKPSS